MTPFKKRWFVLLFLFFSGSVFSAGPTIEYDNTASSNGTYVRGWVTTTADTKFLFVGVSCEGSGVNLIDVNGATPTLLTSTTNDSAGVFAHSVYYLANPTPGMQYISITPAASSYNRAYMFALKDMFGFGNIMTLGSQSGTTSSKEMFITTNSVNDFIYFSYSNYNSVTNQVSVYYAFGEDYWDLQWDNSASTAHNYLVYTLQAASFGTHMMGVSKTAAARQGEIAFTGYQYTRTFTPTITQTITPTYTITKTHTVTKTITVTRTKTVTKTVTQTGTPTFTATPTITQTPVAGFVEGTVKLTWQKIADAQYYKVCCDNCTIRFTAKNSDNKSKKVGYFTYIMPWVKTCYFYDIYVYAITTSGITGIVPTEKTDGGTH